MSNNTQKYEYSNTGYDVICEDGSKLILDWYYKKQHVIDTMKRVFPATKYIAIVPHQSQK